MQIEAKAFFSGCRRIDRRIDGKFEEVQRMRALAERITPSYSTEPRGGSTATSRVENAVLRIIEMERSLDVDIDLLVDYKRFAQRVISCFSDDRFRDLIAWRYINGWGWERIAIAMNLDVRWVYRLHGRALAEAQAILDTMEIPEAIQNYYLRSLAMTENDGMKTGGRR